MSKTRAQSIQCPKLLIGGIKLKKSLFCALETKNYQHLIEKHFQAVKIIQNYKIQNGVYRKFLRYPPYLGNK